MPLTTQDLAQFIGGDMEIQNQREDYLYRGPIESAVVEDGDIKIRFTWCAKNDGGPRRPTSTWTSDDQLDYKASLEIYVVAHTSDGRILLNSFMTGETVVIFPPGGSRLDPASVRGLPE